MMSSAKSIQYESEENREDNQPSTAEVLLAKKQLKMEAMIRRLLVQQQEADATINELSESLERMAPFQKQQLSLNPNIKKPNQLGEPAMGPQHRRSPWHELAQPENQNIHTILQPEGRFIGKSTARSSKSSRHTESSNVHSLISPAELFRKKKNQKITPSPNANPQDIQAAPSSRYVAPDLPKHLDSSAIDANVCGWGSTGERKAWGGATLSPVLLWSIGAVTGKFGEVADFS